MSILNRIRYSIQRGKRQDLLNRYGFYETIETQRGILTADRTIGVVVEKFRWQYTTYHIHTMLDCPFLTKPHQEHETEYSCHLLLKSERYNIELKDLINLLENRYTDSDRYITLLSSDHCHCKCMEWTGHISRISLFRR